MTENRSPLEAEGTAVGNGTGDFARVAEARGGCSAGAHSGPDSAPWGSGGGDGRGVAVVSAL